MYALRRPLIVLGLALAVLVAILSPALADVKLPAVFTDNLVLQREMPSPVWGWADKGERVTVSICQKAKTATADTAGKWMVKLDPMKAGGPFTITVAGKNTITLKNVLVGEVWVCSGQSNMQMAVSRANNAEKEIAAAKFPKIRLISVPLRGSQTPEDDFNGKWVECSPETVGGFSAAGYFFGRDLAKELNVPIGLIHCSYGGSSCESWARKAALESNPRFKEMMARYGKMLSDFNPIKLKSTNDVIKKNWLSAVAKAKAEKKPAPRPPRYASDPRTGNQAPANLYNGMLKAVIPYGMRGVIWYQGETNAGRGYQYRDLFPAMIGNWREDWQQGDFPFYFVQLANFKAVKDEPADSDWAELREAQSMTLKVANTAQAVIIDIGEAADIHPKDKQDVGHRLALCALAKTYCKKVPYSGPTYKSMDAKGDKIVLHFDDVAGGLVAKGDGKLKGFAVAGADKKFVWAKAEIAGDTVVVHAPQGMKPVAVRYAWADNPICNLYNKANLPASPFRTDDWPGITAGKE